MSGLGIVLEESERSPVLRNTSEDVATPQDLGSHASHTNNETLLPPLPESDDGSLGDLGSRPIQASGTSLVLSPSASSLAPPHATTNANSNANTNATTDANIPVHLHENSPAQNIFMVPESYALDSSALSIDTPPITFPSIEASSTSLTSLPNAPNLGPAPAPSQTTSTSPLRRLKSLKKGIRKLSLSRMGSFSSMTSHQTSEIPQLPGRSLYSPQSESFQHDTSSSSSAGESVKSTFSSSANHNGPTHAHSSSSGSNGSMPRIRRRTISMSNSISSATPPLPSPIVTLSEDLSTTKKNIASIEQNFFENWNASTVNNSVDFSSQNEADVESSDKIATLNTPDDLVEYSIYLSQHKKSVESAYDVSKSRLINSGWCSGHDIENLNLQRDSSLSQIDTKLLQIEEKLNSEFNVSFLNNKHMQNMNPTRNCAKRAVLSPSLKDLESKCLYFSAEHGNIIQ